MEIDMLENIEDLKQAILENNKDEPLPQAPFMWNEPISWISLYTKPARATINVTPQTLNQNAALIYKYSSVSNLASNNEANKKDTDMYAITPNVATAAVVATDPIEKTREYLMSRVSQNYYDIQVKLREAFHITHTDKPKTLGDLVQRLRDGKFTVYTSRGTAYDPEKDADEAFNNWYDLGDQLSWRTIEPDHKGYEEAMNAYRKEADAARDEIMVSDPKEGLEILRKLQAWDHTTATKQ